MPQYMLLVKNDETVSLSPDQNQKIVEQYIAFARKLRSENRLLAGDELSSTGRLMRSKGGSIIDGPFAETKESVCGYFLIAADSYEHAVSLSRDCPVFLRGGMLEIREIVEH